MLIIKASFSAPGLGISLLSPPLFFILQGYSEVYRKKDSCIENTIPVFGPFPCENQI